MLKTQLAPARRHPGISRPRDHNNNNNNFTSRQTRDKRSDLCKRSYLEQCYYQLFVLSYEPLNLLQKFQTIGENM